jgi:uncharacterized protein (TIGR00255 family)
MIKSMTGFGKTNTMIDNKSIIVEIRTLNSKQLDINTRISSLFRDKENDIRAIISQSLERGKIDVAIYLDKTATPTIAIDFDLAKTYFNKLTELSKIVDNPLQSDIFAQVLRMPEVISVPKEEIKEEDWSQLVTAIRETCDAVNQFRNAEGESLQRELESRVHTLLNLVDEVTPFEEERIGAVRKKMLDALDVAQLTGKYDQNRFEQELIYYIEKLDITEEKVRLTKHCNYFMDTIKEENSQGKKLGFIVQEMGREVNTIGSKCNHFNIQQVVVRMKDEVEKVKEQLANIL